MKTKEEILKSQLLHDNLPFCNKTFEKNWSFALDAMEEYGELKYQRGIKDGKALAKCRNIDMNNLIK